MDETPAEVSNYEFVSDDRRLCAFAQFGKGEMSWLYSADFYRCEQREKVSLGIG
jgi:hypothetical protein